jgi:bifunctional oligoribonuclease and PAP phosphatase NrnA
MGIDWSSFRKIIDEAKRINLTSHIRPDCDALGSEIGMAGLLRQMGKTVRIVNSQAVPANLAHIDPENAIRTLGVDIQATELMDADLWMILDTSARQQLGSLADVILSFPGKRVIFDHHLGEDDLGALLFKDTTAEATGRLVVDAAAAFGIPISRPMAAALFAAIATDTGWFRFSSVNANTMRVIGLLVDAGASPPLIYNQLYEQETAGRVRLRGVVLQRIMLECDGQLAHTCILRDDYAQTGAVPSETEDLVNHLFEIRGTRFAVIFVEQMGGGFKISLRSRSDIACNEIARLFGGGGHKAAAGAFLEGPLEIAREKILEQVRPLLSATR